MSLLENEQISYELISHGPTKTSAESAEQRGDSTALGAKALVLKIGDGFKLFVLRAYKRIDYKKISEHFGIKEKKIRMATEEELFNITGLVKGCIPPFGEPVLPLSLFIDQSIIDGEDRVAFNAGLLTESVRMGRDNYLKIANGKFVEIGTL